MSDKIPFNLPVLSGRELDYVRESVESRKISGDGLFTRRCSELLRDQYSCPAVLLTHSCTAALEMSAILCDLGPGDEVIMPSFTFVSTANAVVLRGATPVFVDIDERTLNIDPEKIVPAITDRTRAVFVVHYAGVGCDMDSIVRICEQHDLLLLEDAAQAHHARWGGRVLGTFGRFGALSFHETKNIIAGEGGALIINREEDVERAEIIREKGTNRSQFWRGFADKYTWVDVGSSFLPSDLVAAFLYAQLQSGEAITEERLSNWRRYYDAFDDLERAGYLRRPWIPEKADPNGHIFYLLCGSSEERDRLIDRLRSEDIIAPFHYIPLHSSPAGRRFGRVSGRLGVTDDLSGRLIRLPLFPKIGPAIDTVIDSVRRFYT